MTEDGRHASMIERVIIFFADNDGAHLGDMIVRLFDA